MEEKGVFFVRKSREAELDGLSKKFRPLYRSDVLVDREGNITYLTWHTIRNRDRLDNDFTQLSRLHPNADITAPNTRFRSPRELRINHITDDGGSVEAAIRSVEHVLDGQNERELPQARMVGGRAEELLNLYSRGFLDFSEESFEKARQETYRLLEEHNLNPNKLIEPKKKQMTKWLIKGSFGHDETNRINWLISVLALAAGEKASLSREEAVNSIAGKFLQMREALYLERAVNREIFENALERIRPEAIPSHEVFKFNRPDSSNLGVLTGMLSTLAWQLSQPRVKPYRPVGRQAADSIDQIVNYLSAKEVEKVVELKLFDSARTSLQETLSSYKSIYP